MKAQQPIPDETRQAASKALVDLANTMMRSAQGLYRNSAYLLSPDAEVHSRVISDLRRYYTRCQPCSDEVVCIEALLAGMPAEHCITRAEKRRRALEEEKRRWEEGQQQRREEERRTREATEAVAAAIMEDMARKKGTKQHRVDGNVVEGPWGEAS